MSQGYHQICLDDDSKKYVRMLVLTLLKAYFSITILPFKISLASGIFQRVIESILHGIPKIVVYLCRLHLIIGANDDKHLKNHCKVLSCMQDKDYS